MSSCHISCSFSGICNRAIRSTALGLRLPGQYRTDISLRHECCIAVKKRITALQQGLPSLPVPICHFLSSETLRSRILLAAYNCEHPLSLSLAFLPNLERSHLDFTMSSTSGTKMDTIEQGGPKTMSEKGTDAAIQHDVAPTRTTKGGQQSLGYHSML